MAFLELHYHSDTLKTAVSVNVLLPEKSKTLIGMDGKQVENMKTVYLLHGLSDDHTIWMRRTSIERYAIERGVAVVMPNVGRNWYTDTAYGAKYFTFVTEELPHICRKFFNGMSEKPEDNFVAGLSMGGYGAIKAALLCPETFGGCASLSGAFDVFDARRLKIWDEWKGIFGSDLQDPSQLLGTEHDVFALAERYDATKHVFPKMYLWCGTEDALVKINRRFREHLDNLQIPNVYKESEGNHSWKWWDLHIQDALDFLLDKSV
jgi:S-formylglutathione hydrolase FrmB